MDEKKRREEILKAIGWADLSNWSSTSLADKIFEQEKQIIDQERKEAIKEIREEIMESIDFNMGLYIDLRFRKEIGEIIDTFY